MKKFLKSVASLSMAFLLLVWGGVNTYAYNENYPYEIENYRVNAILNSDNTINVTERIQINYNVARQGFYRIIPIDNRVNKPVNGMDKTMHYITEITDVTVNDNFEVFKEDGFLNIKIGTQGQYLEGLQDYVISYKLDIGDDRISEYDDLFFSPVGSDWDCPINSAQLTLTYPKDINKENIQLFSGGYGSLDGSGIEYSYDEDSRTLSANTTAPLMPYEAFTLYTMLPEGYFTAERIPPVAPSYILCVVGLVLAALTLIYARKNAALRKVVPVVNFYPPNDISSAQVGYIIDGITSDKEVLSLIIWLASKGYLFIEEREDEEMLITKNEKKNPDELPVHVQPLYEALFEGGRNSVSTKALNLYEGVSQVKQLVPVEFSGDKKISSGASTAIGLLLGIFAIIAGGAGIAFSGGMAEKITVTACGVVVILGIVNLLMGTFASAKWVFISKGKRLVSFVTAIIIALVGGILTYLTAEQYSFIGAIIPTVVAFAVILGGYISAFCERYTDYYSKTAGDLLGLKEFIRLAEVDRIKALVNENPSYFFDVLPYAYVFGLSDEWIKSFETIDLTPKSEYFSSYNGYGYGYYRMGWMYHSLNNISQNALPPAMTSGTGGNFNSGGFGGSGMGGGFSGGGFGGGGGRSW
ncbi:MAG: DUF2207 domain-containing protein [Oscillospiraceae bacterium]